jgi:hypothetical protein
MPIIITTMIMVPNPMPLLEECILFPLLLLLEINLVVKKLKLSHCNYINSSRLPLG